jgi:hypothetical protein
MCRHDNTQRAQPQADLRNRIMATTITIAMATV